MTHEEAMRAALSLSRYCAERFNGDERNCTDCVFQRKDIHRCILKYYMGEAGEEMRQWAYPIVHDNYKMLKNKGENTSETRQNQHERNQESD